MQLSRCRNTPHLIRFSVPCSYSEPPCKQFLAGLCHAVDGDLPLDPLGQFIEIVLEHELRFVPKYLLRQRNIGETMSNISNAVLTADFRFDVRLSKRSRHLPSDLTHRVGST